MDLIIKLFLLGPAASGSAHKPSEDSEDRSPVRTRSNRPSNLTLRSPDLVGIDKLHLLIRT